MAYNKAKEEYKWKLWKEQERKKDEGNWEFQKRSSLSCMSMTGIALKRNEVTRSHQMPDTDFIEGERRIPFWKMGNPTTCQCSRVV